MVARFGHGSQPCTPVRRPASASNKSEDWTHVTVSTGLAAVTQNGDMFSKGHDENNYVQMCQV